MSASAGITPIGWPDDEGIPAPNEPSEGYDYPPSQYTDRRSEQSHGATPALGLEFLSAADHAKSVDNAPPIEWLARPVWPGDAYGIVAAEHKAGKTWTVLDLVVSVASARPWLDVFEIERPGAVLVFLGEGGQRKMLRRLRAVCEQKRVRYEDLPITLCFRAPHLGSTFHMEMVAEQLAATDGTVLVVVDPLYLAARGAKGSSLFDMGEHLETIQAISQRAGAALVVVHHWNQTGKGKGSERFSGAGSAEWGRVLVSGSVKARHVDQETKASAVTLDFEFLGDEIPESVTRIRRKVWADDPDDLNSPMHYELEHLELTPGADREDDGLGDAKPAVKRVYGVLVKTDRPLTVTDIGDVLATDDTGIPLKPRTIQDALSTLRDKHGKAVNVPIPGTNAYGWTKPADAHAYATEPNPLQDEENRL